MLIMAVVFLLALALARRFIHMTIDLTPQPAFGCLLIATLGFDLGVVRARDFLLLAVTVIVVTVLMAKFGESSHSWGASVVIALITVLSPLVASLYILVAALTWLSGDISTPTTKVEVDALSPPLKVELVPTKQPPGAVPLP